MILQNWEKRVKGDDTPPSNMLFPFILLMILVVLLLITINLKVQLDTKDMVGEIEGLISVAIDTQSNVLNADTQSNVFNADPSIYELSSCGGSYE